jgi:Ser/Thr protein kinase RdoA (MazF antagonist)
MRFGLETPGGDGYGDRTAFPAQSSVLDEEALLHRVVGEYDIPSPRACLFLSRGDSDVYRIYTAGPRYYLKVYRPPHSLAWAESEARFVTGLSHLGIPVVGVVQRRDGTFATQVVASEGRRPALVFQEAPDAQLAPLDTDACLRFGAALANLHRAADTMDEDYAFRVFDCDYVSHALLPFAERLIDEGDRATLTALLKELRLRLQSFSTSTPGFGLCHADPVLSNVRLDDDGSIVFFDFGNAALTWRAYDLAVVHQTLLRRRAQDSHDRLWGAFLDGYERVRELPEGTGRDLPLFLLLRRVSWIAGVMASCPLRMGTETFNHNWVREQMPDLGDLAANLPKV